MSKCLVGRYCEYATVTNVQECRTVFFLNVNIKVGS